MYLTKKYYDANKKSYVKKAKERKLRLYNEVIVPAKSKRCADCKRLFPVVCMDFDHVKGKKKFSIGSNFDQFPLSVLLKEISKCDIVCANCHRIRTYMGD